MSKVKKFRVTAMALLLIPAVTNAEITEPTTTEVSDRLFVETGGYTQLKVDTNMEQKYPLLQVMTLELPSSVKYIGQSLNYLLSLSGYKLDALEKTDQEVLNLYSLKLPLTNRSFAKATTLQIVETIVGVGFKVSVDEVARKISIQVEKEGA